MDFASDPAATIEAGIDAASALIISHCSSGLGAMSTRNRGAGFA